MISLLYSNDKVFIRISALLVYLGVISLALNECRREVTFSWNNCSCYNVFIFFPLHNGRSHFDFKSFTINPIYFQKSIMYKNRHVFISYLSLIFQLL